MSSNLTDFTEVYDQNIERPVEVQYGCSFTKGVILNLVPLPWGDYAVLIKTEEGTLSTTNKAGGYFLVMPPEPAEQDPERWDGQS